jgi:hypothetical protein
MQRCCRVWSTGASFLALEADWKPPLLLSNLISIAPSVARSGAGVVFEPTVTGLKAAILQLQAEYAGYQANAQTYIAEQFSPATHLELHRQLYQSLR